MYLFGVLHGGKGTACQGRSAFLKEENEAATTAGARTSPGGRESGSPSGNTQPRSISSCSEGKEKQFTSTGFSERGLICHLLRVLILRGRGQAFSQQYTSSAITVGTSYKSRTSRLDASLLPRCPVSLLLYFLLILGGELGWTLVLRPQIASQQAGNENFAESLCCQLLWPG